MITVPEASKIIIERSRYLSEALSKDLINISSLARYIKPEVEEMLYKKVNNGSIVMAIKRIKKDLKPRVANVKIFKIPPQISVTTSLYLYRFGNKAGQNINSVFYSKGSAETVMVTNEVSKHKKGILEKINNVSAIIINLPEEAQNTPGIHYFFLKSLAWEGINILETFSNSHEYIMIFSEKDTHRAFRILTSLFNRTK